MYYFYNIHNIILHIMHTVCVTIKLYMAQFYEVEWCRKRMQIKLCERKLKFNVCLSKFQSWRLKRSWWNVIEQINAILFLSQIKHDSCYKIRNTINELEFLIDVAWSIGHGLYFCFKHQLKCSIYTLIISFPFFSININSFLFKVNNLFVYLLLNINVIQ